MRNSKQIKMDRKKKNTYLNQHGRTPAQIARKIARNTRRKAAK
jgi:hypothetical protein